MGKHKNSKPKQRAVGFKFNSRIPKSYKSHDQITLTQPIL